jgi:hypothetical protein
MSQIASADILQQPASQIPAIDRLLCDLLRVEPGPPRRDGAPTPEQISPEIWDELLRRAARYQVTSLLYHRLKEMSAWAAAPEQVRSQLRLQHLQNRAAALALYSRLGQILHAFAGQSLPIIVLKGAFLAEVVYADATERSMGDVDLLAPQASIEQAIQTLRAAGYHSSLDHQAQEDFSFHHHAPPFGQKGYPTIELHWTLSPPEARAEVDLDGVWRRAQPVTIADAPALGLSAEDLLLHLCIHVAGHRLQAGLRALCDLAATSQRYAHQIDWQALISRAQAWHASRSAFLMLKLSKDLLGAPVPPQVLASLQPDDYHPSILSLAYRLIFFSDPLTMPVAAHLVWLHNARGPWAKVKLLMGRLFPPVDEISLHFGVSRYSWRVWLYYPVRWRELFVQQSRMVWKLWRQDSTLLQNTQVQTRRLDLEEHFHQWVTKAQTDDS